MGSRHKGIRDPRRLIQFLSSGDGLTSAPRTKRECRFVLLTAVLEMSSGLNADTTFWPGMTRKADSDDLGRCDATVTHDQGRREC